MASTSPSVNSITQEYISFFDKENIFTVNELMSRALLAVNNVSVTLQIEGVIFFIYLMRKLWYI